MLKRVIAMVLTLTMTVLSLPISSVGAIEAVDIYQNLSEGIEIWDGTIANNFAGGRGTQEDPYQISNGQELAYLAQVAAIGRKPTNNKYYILTSDIYLNDISDFENWDVNPPENTWNPIGVRYPNSYINQFFGNFDGNGYTIYGAYLIDNEIYGVGLFGSIDGATISNLNIVDSYFVGRNNVGGIAGTSREESLIYNCYSDCYIKATENNAGGIIGWDDFGTLKYCHNAGNVSGTDGVGGIVGSSYAEATLNGTTGEFYYCFNTGNISGNTSVGGITGSAAIIENCYNTGNITADGRVGGISGHLPVPHSYLRTGRIINCYNAGIVASKGNYDMGPIVGKNEGIYAYVRDNYYLSEVDNNLEGGGWFFPDLSDGIPKENMSDKASFPAFDFINVWYIEDESTFPQLAFPESTRYAKLMVANAQTNEPVENFTVEFSSNSELVYAEVEGSYYIAGSKDAFSAGVTIHILKDGYETFELLSTDLKTTLSVGTTDDNIIYLSPAENEGSDLSESEKLYILEHINFYRNDYLPFVTKWGFQNALWQYDNGENFVVANLGNWLDNLNDYLSFDFGNTMYKSSYYDVFVMDLITSMSNYEFNDVDRYFYETAVNFSSNFVSAVKDINDHKDIYFDDVQLLEWENLYNNIQIHSSKAGYSLDEWLQTTMLSVVNGQSTADDTYLKDMFAEFNKSGLLDKDTNFINKIFNKFSLGTEVCEFINNSADIYESSMQASRAYLIVATNSEIQDKLFAVLDEIIKNLEPKYAEGLQQAIDKYRLTSVNAKDTFKRCVEVLKDTVITYGSQFFGEQIEDITYQYLSDILNWDIGVLKSIVLAYKIGYSFADWATGLSNKTEQYTFIYYIAPLEKVLEEMVNSYGTTLTDAMSVENAEKFDYTYKVLAAVNKYLYNMYYTMGTSGLEFDTNGIHIGNDDIMELGALLTTRWANFPCHGTANLITNRYKYASVQCPVDVYVYDEDDNLLASIVNEQVIQYDPSIMVFLFNQKKTIVYPSDEEYTIKIVARENGSMNYFVSEFENDEVRSMEFTNIPIYPKQVFTGVIPKEFGVDQDEYALQTDDTDQQTPVILDFSEIESIIKQYEQWKENGLFTLEDIIYLEGLIELIPWNTESQVSLDEYARMLLQEMYDRIVYFNTHTPVEDSLIGLVTIDGERYYFDERGHMQTGWVKWKNEWYYFDENGKMVTGWLKIGNAWYYLDPETGRMYNDGIAQIDESTYYFYEWGGMASDWWYEAEDGWYFFGGNGAMKCAQWVEWKGKWYYLDNTGRMYDSGLVYIDGSTYYFYEWGGMASEWWYEAEDGWYFFGKNGSMILNQWIEWKGSWYYLTETGRMAADVYVGKYYVDINGVWIK